MFDDEIETKAPAETAVPVASSSFQLQDFITNPKWKQVLSGEFENKYFSEINSFLEREYKKGIVRPPKELVFNALNSTSIDQVLIF